jgi:hypothetical protein
MKFGRLLENVQRLGTRAGRPGGVQNGYVEETDGSGNDAYGRFVTASLRGKRRGTKSLAHDSAGTWPDWQAQGGIYLHS